MRIIMTQEKLLILENKLKIFDTKKKNPFIFLLSKCEGPGPLPPWRGAFPGS